MLNSQEFEDDQRRNTEQRRAMIKRWAEYVCGRTTIVSGHANRIASSTPSSSRQTKWPLLATRIQFGLQPLEIGCATGDCPQTTS